MDIVAIERVKRRILRRLLRVNGSATKTQLRASMPSIVSEIYRKAINDLFESNAIRYEEKPWSSQLHGRPATMVILTDDGRAMIGQKLIP